MVHSNWSGQTSGRRSCTPAGCARLRWAPHLPALRSRRAGRVDRRHRRASVVRRVQRCSPIRRSGRLDRGAVHVRPGSSAVRPVPIGHSSRSWPVESARFGDRTSVTCSPSRPSRRRLDGEHRAEPRSAHRSADARDATGVPVPSLRREHGRRRSVADDRRDGRRRRARWRTIRRTTRRCARCEWVFANRAQDGDHRWIGPLIDHPATGVATDPAGVLSRAPGTAHGRRPTFARAYAAMRVVLRRSRTIRGS